MLHVFVKVCCLCQCWCMEYTGCFWGFAVWICSIWSSFVSFGNLRGKFSECWARRWNALGERGGARWLQGGCHVASGVAHQNGRANTEQQLMNTFFLHFEYFICFCVSRQFHIFMNPAWFFAAALQAGSFYPAPPYEVCWRWRCCAMIWPGTFWMSMGRRDGVLRFFLMCCVMFGPTWRLPLLLSTTLKVVGVWMEPRHRKSIF